MTGMAPGGMSPEDVFKNLPAELDDPRPVSSTGGSPSTDPLHGLLGPSLGQQSAGSSAFQMQSAFAAHRNAPLMSSTNGAPGASAASQHSVSSWSSMDGAPRTVSSNWQPSPADGILQSAQPFLGAASGPLQTASTASSLSGGLPHSLDGGLPRVPSMNGPSMQQPQMISHARSNSGTLPQGLQAGLANLTPAQQQVLQQHLLLQQQQQQQKQQGEPHLQRLHTHMYSHL